MNKEVKRYEAVHLRYDDNNIRYGEGCEIEVVTASDYDALLVERDALRKDAERYRWLSNTNDCPLQVVDGEGVLYCSGSLDYEIDAALQGEQP